MKIGITAQELLNHAVWHRQLAEELGTKARTGLARKSISSGDTLAKYQEMADVAKAARIIETYFVKEYEEAKGK